MFKQSSFGLMPDGKEVLRISISNERLSCDVLTYGATLQSLTVPDKDNIKRDIVLGYDSLNEYMENDGYLGAVVGRYANRIAKGSFTLNGEQYSLACNNGPNHLHGGIAGFSMKVWDISSVNDDSVTMSIKSADMEEGYPGNMDVSVTYRLSEDTLTISYEALSDKDTVCNITNHSYFNLNGHASGSVLEQYIKLNASYYTPADETSIPTGELAAVVGTPMDFLSCHTLGERIDCSFEQLVSAQGYDHNYVIDGYDGSLNSAAYACSGESGITMTVHTTMPGVQLYTANFIPDGRPGKAGAVYAARHGFCFETQFFPDSPNKPQFPSSVIKAGEKHKYMTVFTFGTEK